MPYKHEICKAGKTRMHTFYYAARTDMKEGSRRQKENKTSEAQKKVNSRQSVKKLTWIMNENFDGTSLYVTYTYGKENRPGGAQELRADVGNLLRHIRAEYKAAGSAAKYVWVAEVGERGKVHIHMLLNAIEVCRIRKHWNKGWIVIKPLDRSGQYRRLANYFVKYSEKTMKTLEGFSGKRYNSSKNLKIPKPEKRTVRSRNAYNHTIEVPKGWYVDKGSIEEAWHDVTGYMYFSYTLIYDGKSNRETKHMYVLDLKTGEILITEKPRREAPQREQPRKEKRRKGT